MDNGMKKLKVAIVGCGRVSVMHFGSSVLLSDMCELVACCDVKPDRAEKFAEKLNIGYIKEAGKPSPRALLKVMGIKNINAENVEEKETVVETKVEVNDQLIDDTLEFLDQIEKAEKKETIDETKTEEKEEEILEFTIENAEKTIQLLQ